MLGSPTSSMIALSRTTFWRIVSLFIYCTAIPGFNLLCYDIPLSVALISIILLNAMTPLGSNSFIIVCWLTKCKLTKKLGTIRIINSNYYLTITITFCLENYKENHSWPMTNKNCFIKNVLFFSRLSNAINIVLSSLLFRHTKLECWTLISGKNIEHNCKLLHTVAWNWTLIKTNPAKLKN